MSDIDELAMRRAKLSGAQSQYTCPPQGSPRCESCGAMWYRVECACGTSWHSTRKPDGSERCPDCVPGAAHDSAEPWRSGAARGDES